MNDVFVTCIKDGRFDRFGRPLVSGSSYTLSWSLARDLWQAGYVSVASISVFDEDPLAGTSPLDDFNIARALSLTRQPSQTAANISAELAAVGFGSGPRKIYAGASIVDCGTLPLVSGTGVTVEMVVTPPGGASARKTNHGLSAKVVSPPGASAQIYGAIANPTLVNERFDFWVYSSSDNETPASVSLYFVVASAFAGNYYLKTWPLTKRAGWHHLSCLKSDFEATGSPTWAGVTHYRAYFFDASVTTSLTIDRITGGANETPLVALCFDACWAGQYKYAVQLLNKYRLIGNISVVPTAVGQASYMSAEQLKEVAGMGHRLICHGSNTASSFGTLQLAKDDLDATKTYLDSLGVPVDSDVHLWHSGESWHGADYESLPNYLRDTGRVGAFHSGLNISTSEMRGRAYRIPRMDDSGNGSTSSATVLAQIDGFLTAGYSFATKTHDVVASGATVSQANVATLEAVLSGIADRQAAGKCLVVSAREFAIRNT